MENFAIPWQKRKTFAYVGIFVYLVLFIAQYFVSNTRIPAVSTLKITALLMHLIWCGFIVICCNSAVRSEHKKTATWMAIGVCALFMLKLLYQMFFWDFQELEAYTTLRILYLITNICMIAFLVWTIVFSQGVMRVFFGCYALLVAFDAVYCILQLTGTTNKDFWLPGIFMNTLYTIKVPSLFLGAIITTRSDLASGDCVIKNKPLRAGIWGYVFISILCVFVAYLGFTTDRLGDTFNFNEAEFYNSLDSLKTLEVAETYIWTKISWAIYASLMICLSFVAFFINSREGHKTNAVIVGVFGGLLAMISILGIFIDPMSFNFSAIAMALTAVYSLIILFCSLVSIMVSKSAVEHGAVKYLAFGAVYYLLYLLKVYCDTSSFNEEWRQCIVLMLGTLMYLPAGLKYACPRIPAVVNAAVPGIILVLACWLLSKGI